MVKLFAKPHEPGKIAPDRRDNIWEVKFVYAVIKTGGKQYKVSEGDKLRVEKLSCDVDTEVEFAEVLMVADNGDVKVGKPVIVGAKVVAKVVANGKGAKVVSFKYKPKTGYHRKKGHRQPFTEVVVTAIKA